MTCVRWDFLCIVALPCGGPLRLYRNQHLWVIGFGSGVYVHMIIWFKVFVKSCDSLSHPS